MRNFLVFLFIVAGVLFLLRNSLYGFYLKSWGFANVDMVEYQILYEGSLKGEANEINHVQSILANLKTYGYGSIGERSNQTNIGKIVLKDDGSEREIKINTINDTRYVLFLSQGFFHSGTYLSRDEFGKLIEAIKSN